MMTVSSGVEGGGIGAPVSTTTREAEWSAQLGSAKTKVRAITERRWVLIISGVDSGLYGDERKLRCYRKTKPGHEALAGHH